MSLQIGKSYTLGYGIGRVRIVRSEAKGKAKAAIRESDGKRINFGDPDMRNAPGTERAENYCSRAANLNTKGWNANTLSLIDWECIPQGGTNDDDKYAKVMREFEAGTLRSSSGELVTSRKRAEAIAASYG